MVLETVVQLDAPIGGGFDEMNPAARRFRFQTRHTIGRALIQTQAAVDALVEFGKVEGGNSRLVADCAVMLAVIQVASFVNSQSRVWGLVSGVIGTGVFP